MQQCTLATHHNHTDERVLPTLGFTLKKKLLCHLRTTLCNIIELFFIIPNKLKAMDSTQ
ncbi:transcriptional regulator [Sesbania bispinosa]|nr:transcriptional regulator [Sesbania bispinosa]